MSDQLIDMLNHLLWSTKLLTNTIATMNEDQFSRQLDSETRSVKEIILHLISIYAYFSSQSEYKTIVERSKTLDKNDLLNLLKELTKKVFDTFSTNPDKFIPVKTKNNGTIKEVKGFSLFHMVSDHFAYHRGQIMTVFKRITGKEGVGTDYATFLMEDNPEL